MAGLETHVFKALVLYVFMIQDFQRCGHCQLQCPGCQVLTCNWQKIVEATGFFSVIHHWGAKFGCLRGSFFQFCVMKKRSLLGERGTRFSPVVFFDGKLDLQVPPADRRLDMFAGCPSLVMHGGKSGLSSESITVM